MTSTELDELERAARKAKECFDRQIEDIDSAPPQSERIAAYDEFTRVLGDESWNTVLALVAEVRRCANSKRSGDTKASSAG